MHSKLSAGLVAILAATMTGAGGLAASASSAVGGPARAAHAKAEQLRFMSTKATSRRFSVIATGAFTAGGNDRPGRVTDVLTFPGGTLRYRHVTSTDTDSFNPRTCLLTERQTGRFTLGHGTGRYAGVRVAGEFELKIVAVTAKNRAGQCVRAQAPATFQQFSTARGTTIR